uniref:YdhG-like domain-containing protein n=1 Tax=uncultured bacterium AOCefta2 TaxID=654977 RepID=D6MLX7_9BACT|nr:hypothetical protein WISOIL_0028 [uncultured bacterium AOCefta2]
MKIAATTVNEYLAALPPDRREAISAVRKVILEYLPKGYEEGMSYGMIGYYVPHSIFPAGYHCDPKQPLPFASLGSQKHHMALYLMCIYMNEPVMRWLGEEFARRGKKLDMGKACIRFKKLEDLPLEVIGQTIAKFPVKDYTAYCLAAVKSMKSKRKAKN